MKVLYEGPAHTPEWFAARRGKLTASRAGNILADSTQDAEPGYQSRLQEWHDLKAELSGEAPVQEAEEEAEVDDEQRDRMEEGTFSEPLHRVRLGRELGETLTAYDKVVQDDEYPWLVATPDTIRPSGAPAELKKLSGGSLRAWRAKGIPYMHVCQLGVQQRILGVREGGIVSGLALWNGEFRPLSVVYETFDLGEKAEHFLLGTLEAFWDSIQKDQPPPASAGDYDILRTARVITPGSRCRLPMDFVDRWEVMESEEEAICTPVLTRKKALMAEIVDAMDGAEIGVCPNGMGFVLKGSRRPRMKATDEYFITKPSLKFSKTIGFK